MYHIYFIHSSVDGRLGYFHILAIMNSAFRSIQDDVQAEQSSSNKPGSYISPGSASVPTSRFMPLASYLASLDVRSLTIN